MEPREIMRALKVGDIGSAFYFHPDTVARGKEAGLDGFRFYFLGRGGVLGDVEPEVVHAAFGYFHDALIDKIWNSAKITMAPRDAARLYIDCAHELARKKFAHIDDRELAKFVDAANVVIHGLEGASMPLFAAVRAEPVPHEPMAAAMHQAMVLREMRGSAHLLALTACGVATGVAHAIKRPNDVAMFGYDEVPVVTDTDRTNWHRAEELTDEILAPAFARLDDAQAEALIAGSDLMAGALGI